MNSCRISRAAAGADRDADGDLALARDAARQQQAAQIAAGDRQNQQTRARRSARTIAYEPLSVRRRAGAAVGAAAELSR